MQLGWNVLNVGMIVNRAQVHDAAMGVQDELSTVCVQPMMAAASSRLDLAWVQRFADVA
jgi:hypothetical protein